MVDAAALGTGTSGKHVGMVVDRDAVAGGNGVMHLRGMDSKSLGQKREDTRGNLGRFGSSRTDRMMFQLHKGSF